MPSDGTPVRTVEFPSTSVGRLELPGRGPRGWVPARGRVQVPGDSSVVLRLEAVDGQRPDLGFLDGFPGDVLRSLIAKGDVLGDEDLPRVTRLTTLQAMTLGTAVSDAALDQLAALPSLRTLRIDSDLVGDAGLAVVGSLGITHLTVQSAKVTDAGVDAVCRSGSLIALTLEAPHVTDEGMLALARLPALRGFGVASERVTGAFLRELTGSMVNAANLARTALDDEHVRGLGCLPTLMSAVLDRTPLTDAAVDAITALPPMVQELYIRGTAITEPGFRELYRKRPDMTVNGVRYTAAGFARAFREPTAPAERPTAAAPIGEV